MNKISEQELQRKSKPAFYVEHIFLKPCPLLDNYKKYSRSREVKEIVDDLNTIGRKVGVNLVPDNKGKRKICSMICRQAHKTINHAKV
jgi:hypothetical protein